MLETSTILVIGGLLFQKSVRDKYLQIIGSPGNATKSIYGPLPSPEFMMEQAIKMFIKVDINVRPDFLLVELAKNYEKLPPLELDWRRDYDTLLGKFSISDPETYYTSSLCMKALVECSGRIAVTTLQAEISDLQSAAQVAQKISEYTTQLNILKSSERQVFDIIGDVESLLKKEVKVPTGISFLDKVLGGGIIPGKHLGVLGPTGGGKTILATQFMTNMALRGYGSLYIQSEQTIENDITQRCLTQLMQCDVADFRGKAYSELSDDMKNKIQKLKTLQGLMKAVSYATADSDGREIPFTGPDDIKADIKRVMDAGTPLKFVIIDWVGAFIDRLIGAGQRDNVQTYQIAAANFMDELNAFGRPLGITFIYFHQLSNEAKAKGSGYMPSNTDGYYFKAFPNKLEYCVQMGVPSKVDPKDRVAWFCCDKVRDAVAGMSVIVRLNGSKMKLEETMDGEYHIGPGGQLCRVNLMVDNAPVNPGDIFVPGHATLDAVMNGYV